MPSARTHSRASPPAPLEALASPARQELISALGDGPATVRQLGDALGRSRQSLYYHLALLEGAGLVRCGDWRGEGRERERTYELVTHQLTVAARRTSDTERDAAVRATQALLRLTGREVIAAIASGDVSQVGTERELVALRGKARLGSRDLRRLNALIDQVYGLLVAAKRRSAGQRLYAVTIILTPARMPGRPARSPRGKKASR
jgi:DNA-binding transcriptional ArsR family regulator